MKKEIYVYKKGYRITNDGEIVNPRGNIIKGCLSKYLNIQYVFEGQKKKCLVHRLQAYQKYGNDLYKNGIEVRHLNGNKLDNSFENILIGTHSENMLDIPKHIRLKLSHNARYFIKEKHNATKIIKFHNETGKSYKKTMDKFNISSKGTLFYILKNRK